MSSSLRSHLKSVRLRCVALIKAESVSFSLSARQHCSRRVNVLRDVSRHSYLLHLLISRWSALFSTISPLQYPLWHFHKRRRYQNRGSFDLLSPVNAPLTLSLGPSERRFRRQGCGEGDEEHKSTRVTFGERHLPRVTARVTTATLCGHPDKTEGDREHDGIAETPLWGLEASGWMKRRMWLVSIRECSHINNTLGNAGTTKASGIASFCSNEINCWDA